MKDAPPYRPRKYSDPQNEWLLVDVLGRSVPTKQCADLLYRRHPLEELSRNRPIRGPAVY
jgi:hypothetical protein